MYHVATYSDMMHVSFRDVVVYEMHNIETLFYMVPGMW